LKQNKRESTVVNFGYVWLPRWAGDAATSARSAASGQPYNFASISTNAAAFTPNPTKLQNDSASSDITTPQTYSPGGSLFTTRYKDTIDPTTETAASASSTLLTSSKAPIIPAVELIATSTTF
uniref:KRE9 domain-containing protein n=1 Tax=Haemonchus placei TaxID=6290 RepID=A0A0N4W208_HAEPC